MLEEQIKGVAYRLKFLRATTGLTLEEAAVKLGTNKSTINRCETGKQIPDAKYLFTAAAAYDRSAAWILTGCETDKTAFSIKEKNTLILVLVESVADVLNQTLNEKKLKLKWQYYGKILKFLFQLSFELTHEGRINIWSENLNMFRDDLAAELRPRIDELMELITEDIIDTESLIDHEKI